MLYFNTLPKILSTDYKNNGIILTNIITRAEIKPSLLKNPLIYYSYDLQEGDTPDIVADKYYGDSYRYWLVMFSNQILDPQAEWPKNSKQFENYINLKYASDAANASISSVFAYTTSTAYEYRKTITTVDSESLSSTTKTIVIDEATYNSTEIGSKTAIFSTGASVTQTIETSVVSIYDYELELNEAKRNIKLINSRYAGQFEEELKSLMGK